MKTKDIRRLVALFTMVLTIGISVFASEDSIPLETAEETVTRDGTNVTEGGTLAFVERTVDGDTIVVRIDGVRQTIRFIGLNAPESVDPRRADQCFSHEASAYMLSLTEGATVVLVEDASQGNVDQYGRLLRYVEQHGVDLAETMIRDGYAFEYTYKGSPYARQAEYDSAEVDAKTAKRGLWAVETCNGEL